MYGSITVSVCSRIAQRTVRCIFAEYFSRNSRVALFMYAKNRYSARYGFVFASSVSFSKSALYGSKNLSSTARKQIVFRAIIVVDQPGFATRRVRDRSHTRAVESLFEKLFRRRPRKFVCRAAVDLCFLDICVSPCRVFILYTTFILLFFADVKFFLNIV